MPDFFARPQFLGIDISDRSIEVLRFDNNRKISAYNRVELEDGIVLDGGILDGKRLAAALDEVLAGIRPRPVSAVISLSESKTFVRVLTVPDGLEGEALRQAVEKEARSAIPFPLEEAYADYIQAGRQTDGSRTVLYACAPREIVDGYASVLRGGGIEIAAVDIESLSLGRALLLPSESPRKPGAKAAGRTAGTMIADIGSRTTTIGIFDDDNALAVSVTVPVAGSRFTHAIAEKLKVDAAAAEALKRRYGLDRKDPGNNVAPIIEAEIRAVVEGVTDAIRYYQTRYGKDVGRILLAGGSALMPGIAEHFRSLLGLRIEIGDPAGNIGGDWRPGLPPILFANVVGLALHGQRGRQAVDLYKTAQKNKALPRLAEFTRAARQSPAFAAVFLAGAFALLGLSVFEYVLLRPFVPRPAVVAAPAPGPEDQEPAPAAEPSEPQPTPPPIAAEPEPAEVAAPEPAAQPAEARVRILPTPTGWLNVRQGPGSDQPVITRVRPGEEYVLLEETDGWYKIRMDGDNPGWVAAQYVGKE
ncbi:type IV pilus assembly protein PilM [Candidatus Uhrbacteria bacterium]|nr:type IV pilus assembly protein PilM [Candidatus Uhrbacteria bacterium]